MIVGESWFSKQINNQKDGTEPTKGIQQSRPFMSTSSKLFVMMEKRTLKKVTSHLSVEKAHNHSDFAVLPFGEKPRHPLLSIFLFATAIESRGNRKFQCGVSPQCQSKNPMARGKSPLLYFRSYGRWAI